MGKNFLETTIGIPKHIHEELINVVSVLLGDWNLKISPSELKNHAGLDEYLREVLIEELEQYAASIDAWDIANDTKALNRIFKHELSALAKKEKAEKQTELAEQEAAKKANALEEERLRKEGRSLVVPLKDSNKAEAILRMAGISVKLL